MRRDRDQRRWSHETDQKWDQIQIDVFVDSWMSSFSFCSSCFRNRERRFNCDFIYFTELDFVLFCTLLRLFSLSEIQRWIVSLCDFFYVLIRFLRFLRSTIFHLFIVVLIIAKSLSHIIFFHWRSRCDDREMIVEKKKKSVKKKKRSVD
jgi:hypothetical protein